MKTKTFKISSSAALGIAQHTLFRELISTTAPFSLLQLLLSWQTSQLCYVKTLVTTHGADFKLGNWQLS